MASHQPRISIGMHNSLNAGSGGFAEAAIACTMHGMRSIGLDFKGGAV